MPNQTCAMCGVGNLCARTTQANRLQETSKKRVRLPTSHTGLSLIHKYKRSRRPMRPIFSSQRDKELVRSIPPPPWPISPAKTSRSRQRSCSRMARPKKRAPPAGACWTGSGETMFNGNWTCTLLFGAACAAGSPERRRHTRRGGAMGMGRQQHTF